ncbi:gamma-glutamyltransferase [Gammaproteobacteria bacterium]|nr:gamma-glutamyltransferase [Gammaproteobacteria bacterium]
MEKASKEKFYMVTKFLRTTKLLLVSFIVFSEAEIVKGKTVTSNHSMVVTRHYIASEIGNKILLEGGNAVDASVAVSFALSVVLPQASPIGGGGFMMIHDAKTNTNHALDYREMAPRKASADMFLVNGEVDRELALYSYLSSGVPGTVYGLYIAHQKFGQLPWKQLVEPSIQLANDGFIISDTLGKTLESYKDKLGKTSDGKKIFFRNDLILKGGDLLIQKDLANTLKLIAQKGPAGFYKGATAQRIQLDMRRNGGLITASDLRNYKAKFRKPIEFSYKDLSIITMPLPSSGGLILALMLNMIELLDLNLTDPHNAENIQKISEIMQIAYSLRSIYMADSDFYEVPEKEFLSKEKAQQLLKNINLERVSKAEDYDPIKFKFKENTTHYSIVDGSGNIVSTTTTLNTAFGSGIVIKDTGLLMNNEMDDFSASPNQPNYFGLLGTHANRIEPLKRPLSSMTPTIVFNQDKPYLVTGAQGGSRIITAVLQVILNYYEFGLNPEEAVYKSRYHHQWLPEHLMYEYFDDELKEQLLEMGFNLYQRPATYDFSNGITSSIMFEDDNLIGVSDFRSDDFLSIGINKNE